MQNLWRRWYIAHNMPRVHGRTQQPVTQIQVGGSEQDIGNIKAYLQAGIKPDLCWRDAGAGGTTWYPSSDGPFKGGDAWLNTGTWDIDPKKYPNGFKPFSDWVHAHGMQFLLWFEPERVGSLRSWLGKNHPDWVLPCNEQGGLLNEGSPAALRWLIDHVDGMIKSQKIDWYREDMNGVGPLPGWRKNDAGDRRGITENFYVQGHLAFWDELRRRNPNLRIDSCASGGRRNDLETMRRAVPLTRSDFQFPDMIGVVEGQQGHTYGLSFWLPFYGNGCYLYESTPTAVSICRCLAWVVSPWRTPHRKKMLTRNAARFALYAGRLLPVDALQPATRPMDRLAVQSSRTGRRHDSSLPARQE